MADIVSPAVRSLMMAGIKGRDTLPEYQVRRGLFGRGFRYRLHVRNLPGRPDLAFRKHRAVIFVNGCFWHVHGCHLFKWPSTNVDFWRTKLRRNRQLDRKNLRLLRDAGWRVLIIWECALKGTGKLSAADVITCASSWLRTGTPFRQIRGRRFR